MKAIWFITNPGSGSTSTEKCAAIEALFDESGLTVAGRTDFPATAMPTPDALTSAGVDTLVLFAGDGTINTALCAFADWHGEFLILPGGTMNLLAKTLHGDADPAVIVHAVHNSDRRMALPYLEAGTNRAYVGLIIGPAASWFRVREAIRHRKLSRLWRAAVLAWRRTFDHHVRVGGIAGLSGRYQAILARPLADGIDVNAIDARDWKSISGLGWEWLTGDWVAADSVDRRRVARFTIAGHRDVLALFDGEPVMLAPGTPVTSGTSNKAFIVTRPDPA